MTTQLDFKLGLNHFPSEQFRSHSEDILLTEETKVEIKKDESKIEEIKTVENAEFTNY